MIRVFQSHAVTVNRGDTMAKKKPTTKAGKKRKIGKVLKEFKQKKLKSGSKKGPVVTNRKQAIAIALSEAGESKNKRKRTA